MKISKISVTAAILAALLPSSFLASCSPEKNQSTSSDNQSHFNSTQETSSSPHDSTNHTIQIEYYEGLIKELESTIIDIKEENFIKANSYREEIAALQNKIELLEAANKSASSEDNTNQTDLGYKGDQTNTENQFTYEINNGIIIISGYKGNANDVVIPQSINGMPVVAIGETAIRGSAVKKLTIPEGITHIDWFAFADCRSLSEIHISSSVIEIGHGAFDGCSSSLVIICSKDSYAERFAISWGIRVETK
jgi:hypothetical protein